jgi:rhodanese-related sulfurtransferase
VVNTRAAKLKTGSMWPFLWVSCWLVGLLVFPAVSIGSEAARPEARVPYVSPATVQVWLAEGQRITFLDVREADEFAAGHLPGARNIVWDQVASLADQLPHEQPIVLYCIHSAHRAPQAAKTLQRLGFPNAYLSYSTTSLTVLNELEVAGHR